MYLCTMATVSDGLLWPHCRTLGPSGTLFWWPSSSWTTSHCGGLLAEQGFPVQKGIFFDNAPRAETVVQRQWTPILPPRRCFQSSWSPLATTLCRPTPPHQETNHYIAAFEISGGRLPLWRQTSIFSSYLLSRTLSLCHFKDLSGQRCVWDYSIVKRTGPPNDD